MHQKNTSPKTRAKELLIIFLLFMTGFIAIYPTLFNPLLEAASNSYFKIKTYVYHEESSKQDFLTKAASYSAKVPVYDISGGVFFRGNRSCYKTSKSAKINLTVFKNIKKELRFGKVDKETFEYFVDGSETSAFGGYDTLSQCKKSLTMGGTLNFGVMYDTIKYPEVKVTEADVTYLKSTKDQKKKVRYILGKYYKGYYRDLVSGDYL